MSIDHRLNPKIDKMSDEEIEKAIRITECRIRQSKSFSRSLAIVYPVAFVCLVVLLICYFTNN